MSKVHFRFSTGLLRRLGEELNPSLERGLIELVKNSYDADATEVVWTTLGRRHYHDDVSERLDPRGRPYYWIGGGATGHDEVPGSDCVAIARGQISITPLHLDLTHRPTVASPPWRLEGSPRW